MFAWQQDAADFADQCNLAAAADPAALLPADPVAAQANLGFRF